MSAAPEKTHVFNAMPAYNRNVRERGARAHTEVRAKRVPVAGFSNSLEEGNTASWMGAPASPIRK